MKRFDFFILIIFLSTSCTVQQTQSETITPVSLSSDEKSDAPIEATQFPTQTAVPTPSPKSPTLVPTITPTAIAMPTSLPTSTSTDLNGPLIAFRINGNDQFYIALLDLDTGHLREIKNELLNYPLELQWFEDGCLLFVRGRLLDLEGNAVWEVPLLEERGWESWSFGGARLSPDKNWLIVPSFSGEETIDSAEFVNLASFNLTSPSEPIPLTQNGGAHAFATWSPDGTWIAFSDYDDAGIPQLYRSAPNGENRQQLTFHTAAIETIYPIVWKPDNTQIAYGAIPKTTSGAWLAIVDIETGESAQIKPAQLRTIYNIWWDATKEWLVFTGDNASGSESEINWVDVENKALLRTFSQQEAPGGWFSLPRAAGNIDTFFFGSPEGYYLLNGANNSAEYWGDVNLNGLLEALSSPFTFPGEQECRLKNYETND